MMSKIEFNDVNTYLEPKGRYRQISIQFFYYSKTKMDFEQIEELFISGLTKNQQIAKLFE